MRKLLALAVVAAVVWSAPASAARQLVVLTGTTFLGQSATPIAALSEFAGQQIFAAFEIDTAAAGFQFTGPVGGQGEGGLLTGAVMQGQFTLFGTGGQVTFFRTGNDFGNIFTVNNGGVGGNPNGRLDQTGYSTGARLAQGSLLLPYEASGPLPPDVFLGSLSFGRTQQGTVESPPNLITDVTTRDFAGLLTGSVGNPPFMSLVFRQGDPLIGGTFAGLPLQSLGVGNIQLFVTNIGGVPEPSSWAMLIAGFGLVGASLRRRRAANRPAAAI